MEIKICLVCRKEFIKKINNSKKYWKNRKYCSVKCKNIAMKIVMKDRTITWGDKISKSKLGHQVSMETRERLSLKMKGNKLSEETKKKIGKSLFKGGKAKCKNCGKELSGYKVSYCVRCASKLKLSAHFGKDNHRWNGGISKESEKLRHCQESKYWKKECLKRDNYTCQKYKTKDTKLVVHHIDSFKNNEQDRWNINNGITLSEIAHKEFHKKYGYQNNTRKQLEEYLKI